MKKKCPLRLLPVQAEGSHHSFTTLDLRCAYWFFLASSRGRGRLEIVGRVGEGRGWAEMASSGKAAGRLVIFSQPFPSAVLQHDVLNVFIGGMLGGSIMASIRRIIDDPSKPGFAWLALLPVRQAAGSR